VNFIYIYIYIYIYVCIYIYIWIAYFLISLLGIYIYIHIYLHILIRIYIYVYMHIYIYIQVALQLTTEMTAEGLVLIFALDDLQLIDECSENPLTRFLVVSLSDHAPPPSSVPTLPSTGGYFYIVYFCLYCYAALSHLFVISFCVYFLC
jgi:hypothetical protein